MERGISLLGMLVMLGLAWLMSSRRGDVRLRIVVAGLLLQFGLAVLILKTPPGERLFAGMGAFFNAVLSYVDQGAGFLFHINPRPDETGLPPQFSLLRTFAFGVLPTIIFFSSLMSVLYHIGLMQRVVAAMAWCMQRTLGVSGAESLSAAANVFVGHTEAPLVIKPYVPTMTVSELNAVMVGGFATISGGLLAAYVGMGINAGHLMTASVISAPAALLVAKILEPETGTPETMGRVRIAVERQGVNLIEAAAAGASEGLKLALNVGAMLIAFLALLAMIDGVLGWAGAQLGYVDPLGRPEWSLGAVLGDLFSPIAWLMGVEWGDCREAGELLGLKMVANEFVAYQQLGAWSIARAPGWS